jgi:hypothetical protein
MFNGAAVGSEGDVIRQQIVNVTDPSVPGVLNKLGVRYVMIHMDFYGATDIPAAVDGPPPDLDRLPVGLSPVAHFGSTWVYEVARGDD